MPTADQNKSALDKSSGTLAAAAPAHVHIAPTLALAPVGPMANAATGGSDLYSPLIACKQGLASISPLSNVVALKFGSALVITGNQVFQGQLLLGHRL